MPSDSLRIGYLMQTGGPDLSVLSGPQLHVCETVNGLHALGHQVRTIAIQQNEIKWSDDLNTWQAAEYGTSQKRWFRLLESAIRRAQSEMRLPFFGLFDSFRFADACHHLLQGYDILYERHGWMGYGGVMASRWLKIPLILELNGNIVKEIETQGLNVSPLQWTLSRWLTRQTFVAASHVVVVSHALKKRIVDDLGVPEEKISVVLNGANIGLFMKHFDEVSVREQFGLGSDGIVTFVGSFEPWHGVDLLVSSFEKILSEFPNAQLVLVGDGRMRNDITAQISALGLDENVKLLGKLPQEQVAAVINVSDVAVAPYPFEDEDIVGTPLKLIEYMAAGKAIVASTAPIHEIIVDSVTGLRVSPADDGALARAISMVLGQPELRSTLGANARERARDHSWASVSNSLNKILQEQLPPRSERAHPVGSWPASG